MDARARDFLMRLLATASPVGYEVEAASVWRTEAETFADEVTVDSNGNSYARLRGTGPRVVIEGHIDEIGLLISHIDDEGFCWLTSAGGWDAQVLTGQHVRILGRGGPVPGVVGRTAAHNLAPEQRDKGVQLKQLWVDIGATSGAQAREILMVGDPLVIERPPVVLLNERLAGRGLDNRVGAWAALEALRALQADPRPACDVWAVAAVQEEIGLYGAKVAAYHLDPAVALGIDVWHASDHPGGDARVYGTCTLDGGPIINRSAVLHPRVCDELVAAAVAEGIPYGVRASSWADDAEALAQARAGIPAGEVGIPNRYMHSPSELLSLRDLEHVARLCAAFVRRLPTELDYARG